MKQLKYFFLLILVSCSSTKVVYDYDSKADFTAYKTFNFFEDAGEGLNELDVKRIKNELKKGLELQGMSLSEAPSFFINIIAKESRALNRNTIGVGIGSGGGNIGVGISGGIPIGSRKINQELFIDFVESKKNELIWQGVANSEIKEKMNTENRNIHYKKIITEVLIGYPPKKKK